MYEKVYDEKIKKSQIEVDSDVEIMYHIIQIVFQEFCEIENFFLFFYNFKQFFFYRLRYDILSVWVNEVFFKFIFEMIHKWGESSPHLGLVIIYGARWSEFRPPRLSPQGMPKAMY